MVGSPGGNANESTVDRRPGGIALKTFSAKADDVERHWYVVDASEAPLGRLATRVATVLRGKHKAIYTPHVDTGDFVVVVNAKSLQFTGRKMDDKIYDRYTGFHGGLRKRTARQQLEIDPTAMVVQAVRGMLPKNRLGRAMIKKLKVYAGSEHPHAAQKPEAMSVTQN